MLPEILTFLADGGGELVLPVPARVLPIGVGNSVASFFGVVARDELVDGTGIEEAALAGTVTTRLALLVDVLPTPHGGRGGGAFFAVAVALTSTFPRAGLGVFDVGAILFPNVLRDCWGMAGGGRVGVATEEEELARRPILEGVGRTPGTLLSAPFAFAAVGVEGVGRVGFAGVVRFAGVAVAEVVWSSCLAVFAVRGAREEDRLWIEVAFLRGGVARDIAVQRGYPWTRGSPVRSISGVADRWGRAAEAADDGQRAGGG